MPAKAKPQIQNPWPASEVHMWPLDRIKPYPQNPRTHPEAEIAALARDMVEDGVTMPILVDEEGVIIAGHGRRSAAERNSFEKYPVVIAKGWTTEQKRAVRLKDNIRSLMAGWDETILKLEATELKISGYDIPALNLDFSGIDMSSVLNGSNGATDGLDRGRLLELIDITIAEPKHQVEKGSHWILGGRHRLVCVSVIDGWTSWAPLLKDGSLFCPYPGVFVPFSSRAAKHDLVMVQPDSYIAGHILDRYSEVNGKKSIKRLDP